MTYGELIGALLDCVDTGEVAQGDLAYLGFTTASYNIKVNGKPNWVWVRLAGEDERTPVQALNLAQVRLFPDLPVRVRKEGNKLVVAGYDPTTIDVFLGNKPLNVTSPDANEPDLVGSRRVKPGLVHAYKSGDSYGMVVQIEGFWYLDPADRKAKYKASSLLDLTSFIPATSNHHAYVMVVFDRATQTISAVSGTSKLVTFPLDASDITVIALGGKVPLCAVKLTNGMTALDKDYYFEDARPWWTIESEPLLVTSGAILTVSAGAVTATQTYHVIAAESGTTDDLNTITAVAANTFVLLQADAGDTITVKHGTGNVMLNGASDFALSGDKTLLLFYDGTNWSDVGAGGGSGVLADHDHSGDAGDGGTFDAANLTSGAATDGQVLTADGIGGTAWEDATGGGASSLDDLTDVDTTTTAPTDGQALVWSVGDSLWIPGDVAASGLPASGAYVVKSSDQSIPNITPTMVSWATEVFDTGGYFDTGANTRLTVSEDGVYLVQASLGYAPSNTTGYRTTDIYVDGSLHSQGNALPSSSLYCIPKVSAILSLTAGQYVEVQAQQNSGSARNVSAYSHLTYFSIVKLSSSHAASVGVRVTNSSAQAVPNGSSTAIGFNTEYYDDHSFHDTSTNNTRLTVPISGKYLVKGTVRLAASPGTGGSVWIRQNGSTPVGQAKLGNLSPYVATVITILDLDADDYVELMVYQDSGGSVNTEIAAEYTPEFSMHLLQSDAASLDDLTDVDTTTTAPAAGDLLEYDGTNWVPRPSIGARVYNDAAISIPTTTITALTFNSERYDDALFHDTSANTSRLTAPLDGRYSIGCSIRFADNSTGQRVVRITVNGTDVIAIDRDNYPYGIAQFTFNTVYELSAGDYVEVEVYQNSGSALNIDVASNNSPEFWIQRVK